MFVLQELIVSSKRQVHEQKVKICSAKYYGRDVHSVLSLEKGVKEYFR